MIWEYISYVEPYLGAVAIVLSIPMIFFGIKLIRPSVCFAGFLTSVLLSLLVFYTIYASSVDELATFYYWMAGGAVVGFILGWFLQHFVRVGVAILAGWGGWMLGLMINEAFLWEFEDVWVFWSANVAMFLICAVLSWKFYEPMAIFGTTILGSYGLVRGVSVYAGHYYNEYEVI